MNYLILTLIIVLANSSQYVPIQKLKDGLIQGTSTKLVIEAFYDTFCPDSRLSYQAFQEVLKRVPLDRFQYIIHQYPLQYHKNSFMASQGFRYLLDKVSKEAAYEYMELMLINLEKFTDQATLQKTIAEVKDYIITLTLQKLTPKYQINQQELNAALLPLSDYDRSTRASWKFGTSRQLAGTPQFIVNGVWLDGAENYDVDDWVAFINAKNPK